MTITHDHHGHMRVRIADLKTNLSKYIQALRQGGEPIEVCVRDLPVAYLTRSDESGPLDSHERTGLEKRLERRGLHVRQRGRISGITLTPGDPGDHLPVDNTVVAMRSEKDW